MEGYKIIYTEKMCEKGGLWTRQFEMHPRVIPSPNYPFSFLPLQKHGEPDQLVVTHP